MKYFYIILFLTTQLLSGQETIAEFDLELRGLISKRNVFSIIDNENIALFFDNKKEMKCYLLDSSKTVSSEFIFERPHKKYKEIIGHKSENGKYYLYFTNRKKNEFSVLEVNLKTKTSSVKNIDLKLDSRFLSAFSENGKFYVLSLADNSALNLYCFSKGISFTKSVHSIDEEYKINKKLVEISGFTTSSDLEKIEVNTPNSIEKTSNYNKVYVADNNLIITLDTEDKFTTLIKISLQSNKTSIEKVEHIQLQEGKEKMSSNSFFHQGRLYQLSSTKKNLAFSYYNLDTKTKSRVIKLNINDSIWFKNSAITQEKTGGFGGKRELSKTKQFLRKVTSAKVGISIITVNGIDKITIGGVTEMTNGGGGFMMGTPMAGGMVGGAIGGVINVYMSPMYYSYNSYSNTKSTFINCLFDTALNHKSGEFTDNAFDKIKTYEDSIYDKLKLKTVFKYQDKYLFGYYWDHQYKLKEFTH
jgi:hypothetical protein